MAKYKTLPDEYKILVDKKIGLEALYKEESKRKGESTQQSSETYHDNFDFEDADRNLLMISGRIKKLKDLIDNVIIVTLESLSNSNEKNIRIGSKVDFKINNNFRSMTIGGHETPIKGRIAYTSPLGEILLGKTSGYAEEILMNSKKHLLEVLSVQ